MNAIPVAEKVFENVVALKSTNFSVYNIYGISLVSINFLRVIRRAKTSKS